MDFSQYSDDALQKGFDNAMAQNQAGAAMIFKRELDRRKGITEKTKNQTSLGEQALTGSYEGLARGFGMPVDIAAAGLEKLGLNVGDAPVGGSQSIRNLFQALSGDTAMTDVDPQTALQRIVRGGTETVGEAGAMTVGLALAGPKAVIDAAPTMYQGFKQALAQVRSQARKSPGKFTAAETTTALTAGLAGKGVEEIFPDDPTAEMVGELLGALVGSKSFSVADRLITKTPKGPLTVQQMKTEAGRLYDLQKKEGLSAQPSVTSKIFDDVYSMADTEGILVPIKNSQKMKVNPDFSKFRPMFQMLEAFDDKGMTAARIASTRRSLSNSLNDATGSEKNALREMLRIFDANTAELAPEIKIANALYSKAMKAEQMETLLDLARSRATASNLDLENAIRTEFRPLHRRILQGKERGWTADEKEQIRLIVEGGSAENMLRFVGKFAPTGPVSAMGGASAAGLTGLLTRDPYLTAGVGSAIYGLGAGGKMVGSQLQQKNIDRLFQSIVQGRNLTPDAQQRLYAALVAYVTNQAAGQVNQLSGQAIPQ